jgi:hypothetical protein
VGKLSDLGITDPARAGLVFVATGHDRGQLSLFVEKNADDAPLLQDVTVTAQTRATSVTLNRADHLLYVTSAIRPFVQRYGIRPELADTKREVLVGSQQLVITGLSDTISASDLRDFVVDDQNPTQFYALIGGFIQSVAFLHRDPTTLAAVRVEDLTRVGGGSSKLVQATLGGRRVLFASCYDSRSIFILDVNSRQIISVIRGLSGPFSMAVDTARDLMFVADFGASVVRVVDLQGVSDRSKPPPRIVATLGTPHFAGGFN